MTSILVLVTILAPIITGAVQAVKQAVKLPKTYLPLVAIVIGLGLGYAAIPFSDLSAIERLWAGALGGLASSGLYEVGKKTDGYTKL